MTYHRISTRTYFVMLVCAAPIYFILAHFNQEGRGFVAALSVCGIISLVNILRDLSNKLNFWICLGFIAIIHIALVIFVPWGDRIEFGILGTPFVVFDMYI